MVMIYADREPDAPPPPLEWLGAPARFGRRSGSRLVDAVAPLYRSGNLFAATNLKFDLSSLYSLSNVWLVSY
ncbi:hypothetical protein HN873_032375 [Arachis hypogaea]